jgi:hypothetical protein
MAYTQRMVASGERVERPARARVIYAAPADTLVVPAQPIRRRLQPRRLSDGLVLVPEIAGSRGDLHPAGARSGNGPSPKNS